MNNQTYQKQVIEINIKELIWDLLAQWKAVLLVSLIMALLMCGARYAKDKSAFDASIIAQKEAEAQKALADALKPTEPAKSKENSKVNQQSDVDNGGGNSEGNDITPEANGQGNEND